jgi:hypothetical protein
MTCGINIVGVIVVVILLIVLYVAIKNQSLDTFIVFLDDVVIPKTCWDYLVSNGKEYFLFNSKMIVDGVKNPLRFPNKQKALEHLKMSKCPVNIPYVDLVMRKKLEDPTVSFQRTCNNKVAPNLFDLDICGTYGSDYDTLTGNYLAKVNKIESDKKLYADYDVESCMINKASTENPELDDTHFRDYFAQYFDRMNSNIDEEYLYITGR